MNAEAASRFEPYRAALDRQAEDVVQDAYIRWHAAVATTKVADDRTFLHATVARLCLDRLRSARARRASYAGPWLPEPIVRRSDDDPEALYVSTATPANAKPPCESVTVW